ncbi:MAG TPA: phosphoenolpyruvate carboxykinase (ATP) [Nitrososphaerales archaeon]|nr:phosphoenolpyruvate carboxykinase (ATP) [Nitrososphaerales archaeon]
MKEKHEARESSKFMMELEEIGIRTDKVQRNLSVQSLMDIAVSRKEGVVSSTGALSVVTGKFTGRSPDDRYIVDDDLTHDTVHWGIVNHPYSQENFEKLFGKMKRHLEGKDIFIFDGFVGADPKFRMSLRVINDHAWQNLFARQLFIRPNASELESFKPEFTVIAANDFKADPKTDGTRTEAFIIINLKRKIVLIGATSYAGEIKKAVFSSMNYYLPERGIFPMHCSANKGKDGDVTLFFGLSGTGKTTLSADSERMLIGDDEHGWSEEGVFNFEGGCYAKCINLSKEHEPQIWGAIKFGAVMENVVLDEKTLMPDFRDDRITENTRVAYPLDYIPGALIPSMGPHPKVIIFLTADAFGVMPPIARLTKEGAMYHFMSGYTSKLAGTERGITKPKETFSKCFAAPFMPRVAAVYAEMLGKKIEKHGTRVYLINTGWSGGPYGVGERIKLPYTRAMVRAAINGSVEKCQFTHDNNFNLDIPTSCPDVPNDILNPRNTWQEKDAYVIAAKRLATLFMENFSKFEDIPNEIREAGPKGIGP